MMQKIIDFSPGIEFLCPLFKFKNYNCLFVPSKESINDNTFKQELTALRQFIYLCVLNCTMYITEFTGLILLF